MLVVGFGGGGGMAQLGGENLSCGEISSTCFRWKFSDIKSWCGAGGEDGGPRSLSSEGD